MSEPGKDLLAQYEPANSDERAALEAGWRNGDLRHHAERILEFLSRHHAEIALLAGHQVDALAVANAIQRLIVQAGGVDHRRELHDQVKQIHDEIWIRGERGDYAREDIVHDWTSRHAKNWRRWRLKEYYFVTNQIAGELHRRFAEK